MRYLFALIVAVLVSSAVDAQVSFSIGLNVERQPVWGPTGYDHVDYYYMPDIGVYYSVPERMYYYNEGGRWIHRSSLPYRYRHYDLYHSYKVVVNDREPYRNDRMYREKYSSYKGRHDQEVIRDSHESKYFVNKNHPEHKNWVKQQHDGGNGRGRDRDDKRERK
jgi:hypothetical protein